MKVNLAILKVEYQIYRMNDKKCKKPISGVGVDSVSTYIGDDDENDDYKVVRETISLVRRFHGKDNEFHEVEYPYNDNSSESSKLVYEASSVDEKLLSVFGRKIKIKRKIYYLSRMTDENT